MYSRTALALLILLTFDHGRTQTLGAVQGAATIGQPLNIVIPVRDDTIDPAGDSACVQASVRYGDTRLSAEDIRVEGERRAGQAISFFRVRSSVPINEPYVLIEMRVGCPVKFTRSYTLLADIEPSRTSAPPDTPVVTPASAAPGPSAPLVSAAAAAAPEWGHSLWSLRMGRVFADSQQRLDAYSDATPPPVAKRAPDAFPTGAALSTTARREPVAQAPRRGPANRSASQASAPSRLELSPPLTIDVAAAAPAPPSGSGASGAPGVAEAIGFAGVSEKGVEGQARDTSAVPAAAVEPVSAPPSPSPTTQPSVMEANGSAGPASSPPQERVDITPTNDTYGSLQLAILGAAGVLMGAAVYLRRRQRSATVQQGHEMAAPLPPSSSWLTRWQTWNLREGLRLPRFPFFRKPDDIGTSAPDAGKEQTYSVHFVADEKAFSTAGHKNRIEPLLALWDRLNFFESWGQPEEALKDIEAYLQERQHDSEAVYLRALDIAYRMDNQDALARFLRRYEAAFGKPIVIGADILGRDHGLLENASMSEQLQARWPHQAREWLESFILSDPDQSERFPLRTLGAFDDAILLYRLLDEIEV